MLELLLILLGLISNPFNNTANQNGSNGDQNTQTEQVAPGDTGGDDGQVPPRK